MSPIALIFAAGYGYLAGNPAARRAVFKQLQKMSGKAIDSLNKQGGNNAQSSVSPAEEPE